jgi:hypothetical protein
VKSVNWTTVIVAVVLIAGIVAISVAGKQVPDEVKATFGAIAVVLVAMLKGAFEAKPPSEPPQVTP